MKKMFLILFITVLLTGVSILNNIPNNAVFCKYEMDPAIGTTVDLTSDFATTKSAILVDFDSGKVLFEKNINTKLPIASLTKLMTLSVLFDEMNNGKITLDQNVFVSENAASMTGSQAFLDANYEYELSDLLKSIVMSSANDSCVAVAEFLCGTEDEFVNKMNKKANDLGLVSTHFSNCTGLPAVDHFSCAEDVAKILKDVVLNPYYQKYSKVWMDELIHKKNSRATELVNTNRMIRNFSGIDGGKTGHTNEAGYCLAVSAHKNNMRLISVVIGAVDSKSRFQNATDLLNFGFANFESKKIVNSNEIFEEIKISNSTENSIIVFPEKSFSMIARKGEMDNVEVVAKYIKIRLPIKQGTIIGKLKVMSSDGKTIFETKLLSGTSTDKVGVGKNIISIINQW